MLEFKNVCFRYEGYEQDIVDNLSFHIHPGEFVSLIGISGCGKSTIFKLTNGILKKKSGEILQGGRDIASLKTVAAGYMPQKDLLFPWRTIIGNLCLPMEIAGVPPMQQRERAAQMLREVGLLDYADKYPRDLSGGMRQRVSFARTILTDAPLLLLDEPFSALDALTRMNLQEWLLHEWEHFQKTILFITHDVEEAIFMSGKILLVKESPIRELEEIRVPLPWPRSRQMMEEAQILELKEYLLAQLRKQVEI